jgi:dTDP-glucose 4,6-dehydratase
MSSILVTGGAGFLGSHLVQALAMSGDRVTVVDTLQFCHADNLTAALATGRVVVRQQDCAADGWEPAGEFDAIYHLAGVVATREFMARPASALLASTRPLESMLRWQQRQPAARLLFASSSEVYGDAEVHPQPEEYRGNVSCTGPRSGYDEGKRAGESLLLGWSREFRGGTPCGAIVRLFNTYGPRMTANGRLVPTMVRDALRQRRITVNAPGTQTRTLLHVDDCVRALQAAMERQPAVPVNVGGTETMPVLEIAERIAEAVTRRGGTPVQIVLGERLPDDVQQRRPVLDRAAALLGWQPRIPFADGVQTVIDYWLARPDQA